MATNSAADRWRKQLDEAERELTSTNEKFEKLEKKVCNAIRKLTSLIEGSGSNHKSALSQIKASVYNGFDSHAFETAITELTNQLVREDVEELPNKKAEIVSGIKFMLDYVEVPAEHSEEFAALNARLVQIEKGHNNKNLFARDLMRLLGKVAVDVTDKEEKKVGPTTTADSSATQVCALMISEVLFQLVDSVSLPISVTARIDKFKQGLDKGLEIGAWDSMLEEIVNMAADIKLEINTERQDTEVFLKQVTARLQDLDGFMLGSQQRRNISRQRGEILNDAVKIEIQEIESSVQEAHEVNILKQQIQKRLNAIEKHFSSFQKEEGVRHGQEDTLVKKLSKRLSELEAETLVLREKIQTEHAHALLDALTDVPNRLAYDERIKEEIARWQRFKNPLSLVMVDVDHFKRINDNFGHAAGDKALKVIAKLLEQKTRQTDYLARYGGEEFVLIMPGATCETAKPTVEKLRVFVASSGFHFKGEPVTITVSCGIAEFNEGDDAKDVFERADKALYQAKKAGRNQVIVAKI